MKIFRWREVLHIKVLLLSCFVVLEVYGGSKFDRNNHGNQIEKLDFRYSGLEAFQRFEPSPPATSDVPKAEMEYKFRVYATNCSCPQQKKQVDVVDRSAKKQQHLPFGMPHSHEDNVTLRLLYNDDYITAYDLKYRIPMWTAFTIRAKETSFTAKNVCWTGDARIAFSDTAQCGDYDASIVQRNYLLQRPVFPLDFSSPSNEDQVAYITNSIPKSLNHTFFFESNLYKVLSTWAQEDGQLNVVMGPGFDLNKNGERPDIGTIMRTHALHGPLIVPTHIFAIITWCSKTNTQVGDCESADLSAHAFLVPNKPFPAELTIDKNLLQKLSTRGASIEKLTALTFYTGLPIADAERLRTMSSDRQIFNAD